MDNKQKLIYNELISKFNFDDDQKREIKLGLEEDLDISHYAKLEVNDLQMGQIRLGLENNIDVSIYAKPE